MSTPTGDTFPCDACDEPSCLPMNRCSREHAKAVAEALMSLPIEDLRRAQGAAEILLFCDEDAPTDTRRLADIRAASATGFLPVTPEDALAVLLAEIDRLSSLPQSCGDTGQGASLSERELRIPGQAAGSAYLLTLEAPAERKRNA